MRSLATGIESYFLDHQKYPRTRPLREFAGAKESALRDAGGLELCAPDPGVGEKGGAGLTTPVAYVTGLFPDPYSPKGRLPFAYYAKNGGWILFSAGPDRKYDINPAVDYAGDTTEAMELLVPKTYDPTNGRICCSLITQRDRGVRKGDLPCPHRSAQRTERNALRPNAKMLFSRRV